MASNDKVVYVEVPNPGIAGMDNGSFCFSSKEVKALVDLPNGGGTAIFIHGVAMPFSTPATVKEVRRLLGWDHIVRYEAPMIVS